MAPLSEIEVTAREAMLGIVTHDYGREITFPHPLASHFWKKTPNQVRFQIDAPKLFTNYLYQDSLSLRNDGTLKSIQIYRWHQDNELFLDLGEVGRCVILS